MYWHSNNVPPHLIDCINNNKKICPNLEFVMFNEITARNYIKSHYSQQHLYTYDKLKPYAFKSDFWRLCTLNHEGGIYCDLKLKFTPKFKPWLKNYNTDTIHRGILLEDRKCGAESYTDPNNIIKYYPSIQNAFIISNKNNPFITSAINEIITNTKNNYYGKMCLSVTGPALLGKLYYLNNFNNFRILPLSHWPNLLQFYKNYIDVAPRCTEQPHYFHMWNNKDIYNNI
jgi:mannosyltransferase OCH1-like enzyme